MFGKTEEKEDVGRVDPITPEPNFEVRTRNVSVIGPTLVFKGELSANEDLIIEGQIEGKIAHQEKNLTVGKNGRVTADIHAKQVEILGQVEGDIRGDDIVKLAKSSNVTGNIVCGRIVMEDGANFTGSITMEQRATKPVARKKEKNAKVASEAGSPKITTVAG